MKMSDELTREELETALHFEQAETDTLKERLAALESGRVTLKAALDQAWDELEASGVRRQAAEAALVWIGEHCDAESEPGRALAEIQHFAFVALSRLASPPTAPMVDPPTVERLRETPCPLLHAEGRKACSVLFDAGGDSEPGFCWARIQRSMGSQNRRER